MDIKLTVGHFYRLRAGDHPGGEGVLRLDSETENTVSGPIIDKLGNFYYHYNWYHQGDATLYKHYIIRELTTTEIKNLRIFMLNQHIINFNEATREIDRIFCIPILEQQSIPIIPKIDKWTTKNQANS